MDEAQHYDEANLAELSAEVPMVPLRCGLQPRGTFVPKTKFCGTKTYKRCYAPGMVHTIVLSSTFILHDRNQALSRHQ